MMEFTPRQITLSIAFPIVIAVFIYLSYKILKKDINYWGNRLFALFFGSTAVALIFNLTYLYSQNESIILILNLITIEIINIGILNLLTGTLVLSKGVERIIKSKTIYILLISFSIIIIIHILISGNNTIISEYDPSWSIHFGLYELIFSQLVLLSVIVFSIIMYRDLSLQMKKKFRWFIIGLFFLDTTLISITIDNMNLFEWFNTISSIFNFMVVIGAILIYLGIIRK
ncbi:MAG: hypothetical protein ACTSRP_15180 [Candidatus Helarchaeota archaeon]